MDRNLLNAVSYENIIAREITHRSENFSRRELIAGLGVLARSNSIPIGRSFHRRYIRRSTPHDRNTPTQIECVRYS